MTIARWILSILCALMLVGMTTPAIAQDAAAAPYTQEQIQQGNELNSKAIEAISRGDLAAAEEYWTQLIEQFPDNPSTWSNRGNVRIGQNKIEEAIADYDRAIELAPNAPDPYLNRGIAYEAQKRYPKAIADYNTALALNEGDAMAYNNRGNAEAGQGRWQDAIADYQTAAELDPNFAFARANYALALYQTGESDRAIQTLRSLIRKYPNFPEPRAALTAILWNSGRQGEAESNWVAAVGMDNRYQDLEWVRSVRRWPPAMSAALENFLNLD